MDVIIGLLIFFSPAIICLILYLRQKSKNKKLFEEAVALQSRINILQQYEGIIEVDAEIARRKADIEKLENASRINVEQAERDAQKKASDLVSSAQSEAEQIKQQAADELNSAQEEKRDILAAARQKSAEMAEKAHNLVESSQRQAAKILDDAKIEAKSIAGEAYQIKEQADHYTAIAKALENKVNGYGNEYIIPGRSLIEELAEEYSYSDAANDFKGVESQMNYMIKNRTAALCDYVETNRRNTAEDFIVDAFNGKMATIISKVKSDNYGVLKQQLTDARTLVEYNGQAFRNARVSDEYFKLALEKLRLATVLYEMKERDKEEQRAIREQMREEERARREIEKAMKDAAKQEEMLQKAMEKAREKYEAASEEQKAKYEAQLAELETKLKEAEEQNKRAQSMAEQTKSGHVYVISNIGSFGDDIYKIGMTRRLEPLDRIRELGDASVPFPFDVHAMIWTEDAPALETSLHKHFAINQVNKINFRKEFFNVPIATIREEVEKLGIKNVTWTMTAAAREYKETQALEQQMRDNPDLKDTWLSRERKDYTPAVTVTDDEA